MDRRYTEYIRKWEGPTTKKIAGYVLGGIVAVMVLRYLTAMILMELVPAILTRDWGRFWNPGLLFKPAVWIYGAVVTVMVYILYLVFHVGTVKRAKRLMKAKEDSIESSPENSRSMTDKKKDDNFSPKRPTRLKGEKRDGVLVYAVHNKKKKGPNTDIAKPMHGLVIGAIGSGKTTSSINPMTQILGKSSASSSMICMDPKGELFQFHSGMLAEWGYKTMVLDLRNPYNSFRWNPLGDIYDRYQLYLKTGQGVFQCDTDVRQGGLELVNEADQYKDVWYEYKGEAYTVRRELLTAIKVEKQKIRDEIYENLNDLISVICLIESQDDPVWEKGVRSIIMAVCLAVLEDSEYPELEATRGKFCFYNANKAISNPEGEFGALEEYFMERPKLSKPVGLSRQVSSAADTTLVGYMSIAPDEFFMLNDEGPCFLISETDIDPQQLAAEPTVLLLKVPDEKDTRYALAAVFVLCIYRALIKVASVREDLSLPRSVYFILDEFGNMPKIDKSDRMITVGRSRRIRFNVIVQSYAQLDNVYGQIISNVIKGNCGLKTFIGSNDIETCEESSKLCGNKTVSTQSVSSTLGDKTGNINVSSQVQTRSLIYPSELQELNNKNSTGNAIITTFGDYPLKTQLTPSYKYPLYEMKTMDLSQVRMNTFFGDEVYHDLDERNYIIASRQEKETKVPAE